jgi:dihydrofolate reductase
MISAIVCVDENWGIGSKGDLLVHIPEDMKFFKDITMNGTVIMGRKTYDSLPKKPLPNRENVVITNSTQNGFVLRMDEDGTVFTNLNDVKYVLKLKEMDEYNVFIIGGGQIYKELLPYCEYAYVTKVFHSYDNVDTYFPNIDNIPEWEMKSASEIKEYNNIKYQFCKYRKY